MSSLLYIIDALSSLVSNFSYMIMQICDKYTKLQLLAKILINIDFTKFSHKILFPFSHYSLHFYPKSQPLKPQTKPLNHKNRFLDTFSNLVSLSVDFSIESTKNGVYLLILHRNLIGSQLLSQGKGQLSLIKLKAIL